MWKVNREVIGFIAVASSLETNTFLFRFAFSYLMPYTTYNVCYIHLYILNFFLRRGEQKWVRPQGLFSPGLEKGNKDRRVWELDSESKGWASGYTKVENVGNPPFPLYFLKVDWIPDNYFFKGVCVDKEEDCRSWAASGYCRHSYKDYMEKNCKKSCRICWGLSSNSPTWILNSEWKKTFENET